MRPQCAVCDQPPYYLATYPGYEFRGIGVDGAQLQLCHRHASNAQQSGGAKLRLLTC